MMHRRQRHLNPARLGCQVVLDARFIPGQANNTAVQTWTGRTGTSVNATQATLGNRPIYFDATINGRPGVVFDGADDIMSLGSGALGLTANTTTVWAMAVSVCSGAVVDVTQMVLFVSHGTAATGSRFSMRCADASNFRAGALVRRLDADGAATVPGTGSTASPNITEMTSNFPGNVASVSVNGAAASTVGYAVPGPLPPTTNSLAASIGALSTTSNRMNGKIGLILMMSPAPSASVAKRLRHLAAYGWRIKSQ